MEEAKFESYYQSFVEGFKKNIKVDGVPDSIVNLVKYLPVGLDLFLKYRELSSAAASTQAVDTIVKTVNNASFLNIPVCVQTFEQCIGKIPDEALKEKCKEMLTQVFASKEHIAKELMKSKAELACKVIEHGAYISVAIFAIQALNLYYTWKEISQAENILEESREKFPKIIEMIEKLQKETAALTDLMKQSEATNNKRNRVQIARKVSRRTNSLNRIYNNAKQLISDIKVKINGKIERIDLSARQCTVDGASNMLQGAINLFQYWQLGNVAGTTHKIIQGAVTFTYFALAAGNAIAYTMSKKVLDGLRDAMEKIRVFEEQLEPINEEIEKADKWYDEQESETEDSL